MNNIVNQRNLLRCLICVAAILFISAIVYYPPLRSLAQSGVLIPSTIKNEPDPSILSLQVLKVEIKIDNQHAWVKVLQIFDNRTSQVLEGKFLFALPVQGAIADFAVWDGDLRLPGVILEKRRANRLYTQIKEQPVDPGLLQQDDEHGGASAFSAKVFPIPAYGTKRVELEYTEMLPVDNLTSRFSFPLKPSFGSPQHVGELQLHVKVQSDSPISPLNFRSSAYQLRAIKTGANDQEYSFQAQNIELKEDLDFDYTIDAPKSALSWSAHRAPERISAYDLRDPALAAGKPDGYFEARAIFNERPAIKGSTHRSVLVLLDTSLSMHGEKLVRAVEAVDFFLHSLEEQDQFNLALFNRDFSSFSPTPLPVTPDNVERALGFVKSSMLSSGTDLNQALLNAVELINKFPVGERSVVLISDANPTLKTIDIKRVVRSFDLANDSDKAPKARLFALAIGSDANQTLLEELTRKCRGYFLQARETQDISTQLKIIFSRTGLGSIDGLQLITSDPKNFYHIYPAQMLHSFDQSSFAFIGRYRHPAREVEVKVQGKSGAELVSLSRRVPLPERETAHEHLPRLWARARVDALLYEMNLNGEREDYIAEIIRLSQKYKFVTPYTAFLAAPRSLLRPRVIQPGDPVIRVKTDPSIISVFAVLPFGETLPLRFITTDGLWEARFLAPSWIPDGTYKCRLLMTDEKGNGYQEEKSFVIDSHPPRLSAILPSQTIRAGEELIVKVSADRDTMRLIAKFYGAAPAQLAWSDREKVNIGRLRIPAGLASGQYRLTVSAEDFAHNQSSVEVPVTVIGR